MSILPQFHFDYRLKTIPVQVGNHRIDIDCLENLDDTIDALFHHLQAGGQEALLEDLCPYFGVIWPSALGLAELCLTLPLSELDVLEIGCGLALPSLVAAQRGARVLATDSHPEVARFLKVNRKRNSQGALDYAAIDWQLEQGTSLSACFDWVIGSDILYESKHPPLVAQVIDRCLKPGGKAVITDPGRPYLQNLADELKARGFDSETEIRDVQPIDGPKREIFVLHFEKPGTRI